MKNKTKVLEILFALGSLGLVPLIAVADFNLSGASTTFKSIICEAISLVAILNPILFTLAFIVFFWGLSKFILSSGNQAEIQKGRNYMLYGILVLFILISLASIIRLVQGYLEIGGRGPLLPTGQYPSGCTGLIEDTSVKLDYGSPVE